MTPDRWQEVKQKIENSFTILDTYEEELDPGVAEVIEFTGPMGKLKVSFNRQPKVLDKKTLYSHRAGGDVKVDYTYSDTDEVYYLTLFKWNEQRDKWEKMNSEAMF